MKLRYSFFTVFIFCSFGAFSTEKDTSFTNRSLADSIIKFLKIKKTEKVAGLTVPWKVFIKSADSLAPDNDTLIVLSTYERNRFKIKKQAKRLVKEASNLGLSFKTAIADTSKIRYQFFENEGVQFAWVWIPYKYKKDKKKATIRFTTMFLGNSWYLYNELVLRD